MPSYRERGQPANPPITNPSLPRDATEPEISVGQDAYRLWAKYPEPTACSKCDAVYEEGRWTWGPKGRRPPGTNIVVCPACRRIEDGFFAGELVLSGPFLATHRDDIVATLRAEAELETREHPLHRIGRFEEEGNRIHISTTDEHLARRLGEALTDNYHGSLEVEYPKDEEVVRVEWKRTDPHEPVVPPAEMRMPVEILTGGLTVGPEVETYVRERIARLDRFHGRMLSCRVTIEAPEGHHRQGGPFAVSVKIEVPGPDIVVNRQQAKDLHVAIRFAFDAAQRQLEDLVRRQRPEEPRVDDRAWARVARVFVKEGYGFLEAEDGHEIYFHRNSVVGGELEDLAAGDRVRYVEEPGDEGPQATSVVV